MSSLVISNFDLSGKRVRYNGRVLDKCLLSSYIHDVAIFVHHDAFPLVSDIYWDSMKYSELVECLVKFIRKAR